MSSRRCVAVNCYMKSGTNLLSQIKMYKFPSDPYLRKRWEIAVRRKDWISTKHSVICSNHFITGAPSHDPLHPDYVPSKFQYLEREDLNESLNVYARNKRKDIEEYVYKSKRKVVAKKTSNKASLSEAPAKDNREPCISDDEDYRRPLIIPVTKKQKKDDDCYVPDNNSVDEETDSVDTAVQNIFTRKGDDGMTSTFSGKRLYKDNIVFKALGTIEELSNFIGHAKELLPSNCTAISGQLVEIQCILQDMVIHVGTPQRSCSEFERVNSQFPETHVRHLESIIQFHQGRLPKVNPIILPSGGLGSTALHVARGICRRAERKVLCLVREGDVDRNVICYLNRLGDYLFVAARIASFFTGIKECHYSKPNFIVKPILPANIVKPTIPVFASADQGYLVLYPPHPL